MERNLPSNYFINHNRFLLAKLQMDHILSSRDPHIQLKAFKSIPKDIDSAYEDVMLRIEEGRPGDTKLALRVLSWIYRAPRLMYMYELLYALHMEPDDEDDRENVMDDWRMDEDESDPDSDSEWEEENNDMHGQHEDEAHYQQILDPKIMINPIDIIQCCRCLIIHEEGSGVVRFSHETVRGFIQRKLQEHLLPAKNMARVCLTYLTCAFDLSQLHSMEPRDRFLRYATNYWSFHLRGEPEGDHQIQLSVLLLLQAEEKRDLLRESMSPLFMQFLPLSPVTSLSPRIRGHTLLHVLAENGLATICKVVLGGAGEFDRYVLVSVYRSIHSVDQRLVTWLKEQKDLNTKNTVGNTALHLAAMNGHEKVVELLVTAGAKMDIRNDDGGHTALSCAVKGRNLEVVKLLVHANEIATSIDGLDDFGRSPLMQAAEAGFADIARVLIDAKAKVYGQSSEGDRPTALHLAAINGHDELVEILIENGADIEAGNRNGSTALQDAASGGRYSTVQLLLSKNANPLAQGTDGETPLSQARDNRNREVERLLEEYGAGDNTACLEDVKYLFESL
jgi:ankyrin repeat protein